jgi:Tfp pilus assembly protein PilO
MKVLVVLTVFCVTNFAYAFNFKAEVEKLAKDKKNQEKAKELVEKGIEYLNKNKKENKAKK